MYTIPYLTHVLLYDNIEVTEALSHIKDLAEAVESQPLLEWADSELKGYENNIDVPAYRLLGRFIEVDYVSNSERIFNLPIPNELFDPLGKSPHVFSYLDGVDDCIVLMSQADGKLYYSFDEGFSTMQSLLREFYGSDIELTRVMLAVKWRFIYKVVLAIQEVMLNFLLTLENEFGQGVSIDFLKVHNKRVSDLFIKARNLVGKADHLYLPLKPKSQENIILSKDDDDAFCRWLCQHDVMEDDLFDEFFELRDEYEKTLPTEGIIPPKIYDWAEKLIAINPRFGDTGEKLHAALKIFFGVKD